MSSSTKNSKKQPKKQEQIRTLRERRPAVQEPIRYEIEKLLKKQVSKKEVYYLVKWYGYSSSDSTWEKESNLGNISELVEKFEQQQEIKNQKNKTYVVEKLVNKRILKGKLYYEVKWQGYPNSQNTWESHFSLKDSCDDLIKAFNQEKNKKTTKSAVKNQKNTSKKAKKEEKEEYYVEEIISENDKEYEVKWEGYDQTTFEPKKNIEKQVPELVKQFQEEAKQTKNKKTQNVKQVTKKINKKQEQQQQTEQRATRSSRSSTKSNKSVQFQNQEEEDSEIEQEGEDEEEGEEEEEQAYEIEKIIAKKGQKYQIKWKGFSLKECTMEPVKSIQKQVPELVKQFEKKQKK